MEERRYFQYLAGPRKGEIVEFDHIEEEDEIIFVVFKDNSRCNEELILPLNNRNWSTQLMAEISDPNNVWRFKEEWVGRSEEKWATNAEGEKVCVQPFVQGRKKVTPIPPKKVQSNFGHISKHSTTPPPPSKEQINLNDPVYLMMDKAKKFLTDIPMVLTVSLPSKSLYDVAKESFEDGGKKVIEYIIKSMDDKKLKESLAKALAEAYEDEENVEVTEDVKTIEIDNSTKEEPKIYPEKVIHRKPIMIKENKSKPEPKKEKEKEVLGFVPETFKPDVLEEAKIGEPVAKGKIINASEK